MVSDVGATEIWPRRVRSTVPVTPTMSPRSTVPRRSQAAGSRLFTRKKSWIWPVWSWSITKQTLPWLRMARTRPATQTTSSVSWPGSREA